MVAQLTLFPSAADASVHGWIVGRDEPDCDGTPGYRVYHRSGDSAWVPAHEWPAIVAKWNELYRRADTAPGEMEG